MSRRATSRSAEVMRCTLPAAALLLLAGGCSGDLPPDVIAVTDTQQLTETMLRDYVLALPPEQRARPSDQDESAWMEQFVRAAMIQLETERLAAAAGVPTPEDIRFQVWWGTTSAAANLARRQLASTVTVDEAELERRILDRVTAAPRRPLYSFHNIFLRLSDGDDPTARAERLQLAEHLRTRAATEDFATLAREYSDSANAEQGGAVLNSARQFLDAPIADALAALQEGEVSEVLATRSGLHILRLDRVVEVTPTEDEVRNQVRSAMLREAIAATEAAALEKWRSTTTIDLQPGHWRIGPEEIDVALLDQLGHSEGRLDDPNVQNRIIDTVLFSLNGRELADLEALSTQFERLSRANAYAAEYQKRFRQWVSELSAARFRTVYDAQPSGFALPAQSRLRLIWIPEGGDAWRATLRAEQILEEVRAGADFAAIARRESAHASAENGGDLGWLLGTEQAAMHPHFWELATSLEPGEINFRYLTSRILNASRSRISGGVAIVEKHDHRPAQTRSFEEALPAVRERFLAQNATELREEFDTQLLSNAGFRILRIPTAAELVRQ